jgi:hypothetical protein
MLAVRAESPTSGSEFVCCCLTHVRILATSLNGRGSRFRMISISVVVKGKTRFSHACAPSVSTARQTTPAGPDPIVRGQGHSTYLIPSISKTRAARPACSLFQRRAKMQRGRQSSIRAADVVLHGAFRGTEIEDIDARVAELERAAETSKTGRAQMIHCGRSRRRRPEKSQTPCISFHFLSPGPTRIEFLDTTGSRTGLHEQMPA